MEPSTPPNEAIREAGSVRPSLGNDAIQAAPKRDAITAASPPPRLQAEEVQELVNVITAPYCEAEEDDEGFKLIAGSVLLVIGVMIGVLAYGLRLLSLN